MNPTEQQRMAAFYQEKIAICKSVKRQISRSDPYRDLKLRNMNARIQAYEAELARLPQDKSKLTAYTGQ